MKSLFFAVFATVFLSSCGLYYWPEKFERSPINKIDDSFEMELHKIIPNSELIEYGTHKVLSFDYTPDSYHYIIKIIKRSFVSNCHGTFVKEGSLIFQDDPFSPGIKMPNPFSGIKIPGVQRAPAKTARVDGYNYSSFSKKHDFERLFEDRRESVCTYIDRDVFEGMYTLNFVKYFIFSADFEKGDSEPSKIYIVSLNKGYIYDAFLKNSLEEYNKISKTKVDESKSVVYDVAYFNGSEGVSINCRESEDGCKFSVLKFLFDNSSGIKGVHRNLNDVQGVIKDGKFYSAAWRVDSDGGLMAGFSGGCTLVNNRYGVIVNPSQKCVVTVNYVISGLTLSINSDYKIVVGGKEYPIKVRTQEYINKHRDEFK